MMMLPQRLEKALIDAGLVPKNCRRLEVIIAPMQATILRYEVFVDQDDMGKLATSFAAAVAPTEKP